jgi:hypothetical protein
MKLVRYGNPGKEKPGLIDADGKLRDLSAVVPDIGPDQLGDAASPSSARPSRQAAAGARQAALGLPGRQRRQVHRHRPELRGPRGRIRPADPKEPWCS